MLPKRLKELREKSGYLQKFVADKLGVKSNTLSGYENGTRSPDPDMLISLAKLYDVTTDYLLGKSDSPALTEKDEQDIAKRMEKLKKDLTSAEGLSFHGEPLSEEAIESLLEAIEYAERQTTRINKKYIPKKYRKDNK
ncbi:helix-turn-helix domain-containing protein [Pueribacillus sp. YX66]|uniref:helix-turn-helix domain-containing protein n=1 Tax=Pueribacillus sp. YX66 TaxID=3229242 RepID=UPI00358D3141